LEKKKKKKGKKGEKVEDGHEIPLAHSVAVRYYLKRDAMFLGGKEEGGGGCLEKKKREKKKKGEKEIKNTAPISSFGSPFLLCVRFDLVGREGEKEKKGKGQKRRRRYGPEGWPYVSNHSPIPC